MAQHIDGCIEGGHRETRAPVPHRAFCIFEGGGAKGLAHLGVLRSIRAAEHAKKLTVLGYAGTSAGAIIAALAAAGYQPREIYDPSTGESPLLKRVAGITRPADVLGWGRYTARIMRSRLASSVIIFLVFVVVSLGVSFPLAKALSPIIEGNFASLLLVTFSNICATAIMFLIFRRYKGFSSLDTLEVSINAALCEALKDSRVARSSSEPVTFGELYDCCGAPLKIVAANISNSEQRVFSALTTPDVSVAKAVAASASIPVLFRPIRIRDHKDSEQENEYCDGGLVSNLPAWTFGEEAIYGPRTITITSELSDPISEKFGFLAGLLRTAVFGAHGLNTRGLKNHAKITSDAPVDVLDFEMGRATASYLFTSGRRAAFRYYRVDAEAQSIVQACQELLVSELERFSLLDSHGRRASARTFALRYVSLPGETPIALRVWKGSGFVGDIDEDIIFPAVNSAFERIEDEGSPERQFEYLPVIDENGLLDLFGHQSDDGWLRSYYRPDRTFFCVMSTRKFGPDLMAFLCFDTNASSDAEDFEEFLDSINLKIQKVIKSNNRA